MEIPYPEFYVFYNGEEAYPVSKTLRLSEAFKVKDAPVNLELKVEVININTEKHSQILGKCRPLEEYSRFVEIVRRHVAADKNTGFKNAIEECVKNGILREYLGRKTREVMNMLIAEYDYATDIAVQRQEAWDKSARHTALNMLKEGYKINSISTCTGLSPEVIRELKQEQ